VTLDDSTFGFNKPDAFELIQLIGNRDMESPDPRPRQRRATGACEIVEFEFDTSSGDEDVPNLCSLRNTSGAGTHSVTVIKYLCGKSSPATGEVDGHITVIDDLGLLTNRDGRDLPGRKGLAVLMAGSPTCQWVIVYIDFHRIIQVVTDVIFTETGLTIERKNVSVWDDCDLPDEVIEGADCTPPEDY